MSSFDSESFDTGGFDAEAFDFGETDDVSGSITLIASSAALVVSGGDVRLRPALTATGVDMALTAGDVTFTRGARVLRARGRHITLGPRPEEEVPIVSATVTSRIMRGSIMRSPMG
jgi:hypothetical protein